MKKLTRFTLLFLYNPQKISPQPYYTENLGIQYIGAILRQAGFNAQVINADYTNMNEPQLVKKIQEFNTQFIGMAPCYITIKSALKIAETMKQKQSSIKVCFGGHHATFCADDILKAENCIDFVVRGEGEHTIIELAEAIESTIGDLLPLNTLLSIDGLSFRHEGKIYHNNPRALIEDLDIIPFPIRTPLDKVLSAGEHSMPLLCTSRGCPNNCSFCSTPKFYRQVWRGRSAKNVVDEIQEVIEKYGFTQFYLTDDQFAGKGKVGKQHVANIIAEIKRRRLNEEYDLYFFLMVRADFFRKENEDVISQLPEVGFRDIFIGFESGDPGEIKLYAKGITINQYREALDLLHKYKLFVEGGFITFNPYTTFESLGKDAVFIKELGVPVFGYYTSEIMAFPGTRFFEKLIRDGLMIDHSYKEIKFKYRDNRVGKLHDYLRDFFELFQESDNELFEAIDFQVKIEASLDRVNNECLKEEAEFFIERAKHAFKKISDLNFEFVNQVIDVFEKGGDRSQCISLEQGFTEKHHKLSKPIIENYLNLNTKTGIIHSVRKFPV